MTGFAYPEVLRQVSTSLAADDRTAAYATFVRYLPLLTFEAQPGLGLGIRKELLRRRGVIANGMTRVGTVPAAELLAELGEVLDALAVQPTSKPLVP